MNFKKIKSLVATVMVGILCVGALTGCTGEKPEATVTKTLDAVKQLDRETVQKGFTADATGQLIMGPKKENDNSEKMIKMFFENLSYKVLETKVDGEKATVKVEIKNTDLKKIMSDFMSKSMEIAMSNAFAPPEKQMKEEDIKKQTEKIFTDHMANKDKAMATAKVDVKLTKTKDGWKIEGDEAFYDAVTGGMLTFYKEMQSSMGGAAPEAAPKK